MAGNVEKSHFILYVLIFKCFLHSWPSLCSAGLSISLCFLGRAYYCSNYVQWRFLKSFSLDWISLSVMSDIKQRTSLTIGALLSEELSQVRDVFLREIFRGRYHSHFKIAFAPSNFRTRVMQLLVTTWQSPNFRWNMKNTGTGGASPVWFDISALCWYS